MSAPLSIFNWSSMQANPMFIGYGLVILGFVLLIGGFVCFAGAFCGVPRTYLYGSIIAVGSGVLGAAVLAAVTRVFLPELAAAFTLTGLAIFCLAITLLVLSVPLLQHFWQTSYPRVFASIFAGVALFIGAYVLVQGRFQPNEVISARQGIPILLSE